VSDDSLQRCDHLIRACFASEKWRLPVFGDGSRLPGFPFNSSSNVVRAAVPF